MMKKLKRMLMRMFTTKEMRWRNWERSIHKEYKPRIAVAKTVDERESLRFQYDEELWEIIRERREYTDRKLISKARCYDIPIPSRQEEDGLWMEYGPDWLLTEKGVYHLKKAVQEEQKATLALHKARLDLIVGWAPLITGMVGLVGALIGLVSVIRK